MIRITRDASGMGYLGLDSDESTGRKRLAPHTPNGCEHSITIAAKPHPKSACQLQRSLGSVVAEVGTGWCAGTPKERTSPNK